MNIEEKVKANLLVRGFDNKTQLNNRGLIGATIDETILEVVKNLRIADVGSSINLKNENMTIWKFELKKERTQLVKMPEKSEIMDIQIQNGKLVMWALVDTASRENEVKINMYGTGWNIHNSATIKDEYLATIQDGEFVWHFFMNYEV